MVCKNKVINILSLSSLFLTGIVIGNSCSAINKSKGADWDLPLAGSVGLKEVNLTLDNNVDKNKDSLGNLQSFEDFLGHHLGYLKYTPLVLKKADFGKNNGKDTFKTILENWVCSNLQAKKERNSYRNGIQYYLNKNFFPLFSMTDGDYCIGSVQIRDHEFMPLARSLNAVSQHYQNLGNIAKELWEVVRDQHKTNKLRNVLEIRNKLCNFTPYGSQASLLDIEKDAYGINEIINKESAGGQFDVKKLCNAMVEHSYKLGVLLEWYAKQYHRQEE